MTNIDFDERSVREVNVEKQAAFECRNHAIQGDAIMGVALQEKGVGVVGKSDAWMAVVGMSKTYQGVHGMVESGIGVVGSNNGAGTGVWGLAPKGTGIRGESVDGVGVYGSSDKNAGVVGESVNWYGVYGFSKPEHIGGVLAEGGRYALVARNGKFAAARIEGDCEVTGDIRLLNADCAEDFDIVESEENVEAGTVMVLN